MTEMAELTFPGGAQMSASDPKRTFEDGDYGN